MRLFHFYERAIWCFGKQLGRNQFHIGLCYGQVTESGKLEKKQVRCNLVGAKSLEGLGTLGRLILEGLLLFMYPNYIFQQIIDCLKCGKEVLCREFRFPLQQHIVVLSLCLHLSSLNLCLLFSTVDVILIGLDCLPILFIACVHFPHTYCLS